MSAGRGLAVHCEIPHGLKPARNGSNRRPGRWPKGQLYLNLAEGQLNPNLAEGQLYPNLAEGQLYPRSE
jgi:hypothetical protein